MIFNQNCKLLFSHNCDFYFVKTAYYSTRVLLLIQSLFELQICNVKYYFVVFWSFSLKLLYFHNSLELSFAKEFETGFFFSKIIFYMFFSEWVFNQEFKMRSKPKQSMTHAMCRVEVCLFCFEKKKDCRLLSRTTALYQKVFHPLWGGNSVWTQW